MARSWWVPPQLHKTRTEEREESWLELFYDLVYVATLIQLGNRLSDDISLSGVLAFIALFIPIWWSWTGITFYINRFVVDDILHRLLIFAQIFFISILAISLDGAFEDESTRFVLAYAGIRLVLILLYLRTRKHTPDAWPLARRYVGGFTIALAIWLLSLLFPPPWQYVVWGIGMIADFATTLVKKTRSLHELLPPDEEHMSGRYGTFTIIVLGEAFVKVTGSAADQDLAPEALVNGLSGLVISAALWWIYFDDVADSCIRALGRSRRGVYVWIYTHLPLAIAVTAFGVAIKKLALHPSDVSPVDKYRWLGCGAVALALACVALIDSVTIRQDGVDSRKRAEFNIAAAVCILLLAAFGSAIPLLPFLIVLALLSISPIIADIILEHMHGKDPLDRHPESKEGCDVEENNEK